MSVTSETGPWAKVPIWILTLGLRGHELATYVALASWADRDGEAHPRVRQIAERAGIAERSAERSIKRLRELGVLEVTQWKHEYGGIGGCHYHLKDTPRPATQTPPTDPDVARGTDPDVARGTDPDVGAISTHQLVQTSSTELTSFAGAQGAAQTPPPPAQTPSAKTPRGTRLPEGWMPSKATIAAIKAECPDVDLAAEHRRFTDYWRATPGQKGVKIDWDATWRNWIRRAADDTRRSSAPRVTPRTSERQTLYEQWDAWAAQDPTAPAITTPTPRAIEGTLL